MHTNIQGVNSYISTDLLEQNTEDGKSRNGPEISSVTPSAIITEDEGNQSEVEYDFNVMLDRWLEEPFDDEPYVAGWGEKYHMCDSGSQGEVLVEGNYQRDQTGDDGFTI